MSDLWKWVIETEQLLVKKGERRLAEVMDKLPTEVCNDRHERADALAMEGVALARSLELPWVEVFLRHWHLQSRVFHRMEGETALRECVELVDFAHREDTKACPQSVCVVQDLAACYGFVDGPGYADERLSVADETLARIDATWPCFSCISGERAAALRAKGENQAALDFLDAQVDKMTVAGNARAIFDMPTERVEALLALGRFDDALAFLDEDAKHGRRDAHHLLGRRVDRARALGRLGRLDEALATLPPAREIVPTPFFYQGFAEALALLVRGRKIDNEWALGRMLRELTARLVRQGCLRIAFDLAAIEVELAIERGAPHVARRTLAVMEELVARLRKPLDPLDRVRALAAAIERVRTEVELPGDPDAALRSIAEAELSPEAGLRVLDAASARWPADATLARMRARALTELGFAGEASNALEALADANPGDDELALEVGRALLDADDVDALDRFLAKIEARAEDEAARGVIPFLKAVRALNAGDVDDCIHACNQAMGLRPGDLRLRLLRAKAARLQRDWATELAMLDEVVASGAEPGLHDWDRIIAGTMLGAWAEVRASAVRLGMEVEGEGPIDEQWAPCRLRFDDEPDTFAVRTGPATARVVEMAPPPRKQRYGEVVVFEPRPLDPAPANEEQRARHVFTYSVVAVLRESEHGVFFVDGVRPSDEALDRIGQTLADHGATVRVLSNERYVLPDGRQGLYLGVAVPHDTAVAVLNAVLTDLVQELEAELTWLDLARAAGDEALVEEQRALAERLGL